MLILTFVNICIKFEKNAKFLHFHKWPQTFAIERNYTYIEKRKPVRHLLMNAKLVHINSVLSVI